MTLYTVSGLNARIRTGLEAGFYDIWVEGEISNLSRPGSGHVYFSLKDDRAQVACALFKGNTARLRLPAHALKNGLAVKVHGRATLYEPRGSYQLILDQISIAGIGALEAERKRRYEILLKEGCFAAEVKRPVPVGIKQIGVITSASGAAVHDVLTTLARRNPALAVVLYPAVVQGEAAPQSLLQALEAAGRRQECEILLLVRGGGSIEDLWAFNDPAVVRAVAASPVPVISGVGHETDVTLVDYAADLRAPTPTAAAELACPDQYYTIEKLRHNRYRLQRAADTLIQQRKQTENEMQRRLQRQNPVRQLQTAQQRADDLSARLDIVIRRNMENRYRQHQKLSAAVIKHTPVRRILQQQTDLAELNQRLHRSISTSLQFRQQQLQKLMQNLHHLSPLNILQRGYAMAFNDKRKVITDSREVQSGEKITLHLATGKLFCTVKRRAFK